MKIIDDWYLENLVCPQDKTTLNLVDNNLVSELGNSYPIVNGIPIMLLNNVEQTIELASNSLSAHKDINDSDPYFINTLGITENEKQQLREYIGTEEIMNFPIDPVVDFLVGATNGILKPNSPSFIQMPNRWGIRSLQHQIKRGFSEGENFDVRYWGIQELLTCFTKEIGHSTLSIDGFFGLGIQKSDIDLLPLKYKLVVRVSESLKILSLLVPFLKYVADSVYIESTKSI